MNDVEHLGDEEEDLAYRPLSFEDDLFTARVYKRNFGRPVIPRISNVKRQEGSEEFTQHAATQNDHKELVGNGGAERVISKGQGPLQNEFASTDVGCTNSAIVDKRDINGPDSKGPINQDSKFVSPSIFFEACRQGDYETVENLLQNGQDVNVQSSWTYNPDGTISAMHVIARQGHIEVARSLMKYGADIKCATFTDFRRPLHSAARLGHISMVHFLIENGANFAAQTTRGVQPIQEGAAYGSREIAKILLDHGAAVDSRDLAGIQPLHYASQTLDQPNVIRYLHSQGTNIEARCSEHHRQ